MADTSPKKINRQAEWGFIFAPLAGLTAVFTFHALFTTFDSGALRLIFHFVSLSAFIVPSYFLTIIFGLPAHIIIKRKKFNVIGWRGMAFYTAYGGLVGALFLLPFISRTIDSAGVIFGINTTIIGAIAGFSMWFIGVRKNPDFDYVESTPPPVD